ncbi:hypothetical protein Vi05172_g10683 [Venturia inaequalis]|nr:hypothetical protein Vi05172_g10683 [Venturia inaequalis]
MDGLGGWDYSVKSIAGSYTYSLMRKTDGLHGTRHGQAMERELRPVMAAGRLLRAQVDEA